jgi:hypothetical protein
MRRPLAAWLQVAAVAAAAIASIATPAPRYQYPRAYPAWQIVDGDRVLSGCASLRVWVSKSGKEGLGLTVMAAAEGDAPCEVAIDRAVLTVAGQAIPAARLPERAALAPGEVTHLYLPFPFDGEGTWNRGQRRGRLELVVLAGEAAPRAWDFALVHHRDGPHRKVDRWKEDGR